MELISAGLCSGPVTSLALEGCGHICLRDAGGIVSLTEAAVAYLQGNPPEK